MSVFIAMYCISHPLPEISFENSLVLPCVISFFLASHILLFVHSLFISFISLSFPPIFLLHPSLLSSLILLSLLLVLSLILYIFLLLTLFLSFILPLSFSLFFLPPCAPKLLTIQQNYHVTLISLLDTIIEHKFMNHYITFMYMLLGKCMKDVIAADRAIHSTQSVLILIIKQG